MKVIQTRLKKNAFALRRGLSTPPFFDRDAEAGRGEGQLCGREDERASVELQ